VGVGIIWQMAKVKWVLWWS